MKLHRSCWEHDRPFERQRNTGVALRTYRAISWLECASSRDHDPHATFVFLWISFNAAYSAKSVDPEIEVERQRAFFHQLLAADRNGVLSTSLQASRPEILTLLDSKQIYWRRIRNQEGDRSHGDWNTHFRRESRAAQHALANSSQSAQATVLTAVFARLATLRNLLIHGQISWRSRVAAPIVETATDFLRTVLPVFVHVMIDNRDADWAAPSAYPDIYRQERIEPKT